MASKRHIYVRTFECDGIIYTFTRISDGKYEVLLPLITNSFESLKYQGYSVVRTVFNDDHVIQLMLQCNTIKSLKDTLSKITKSL